MVIIAIIPTTHREKIMKSINTRNLTELQLSYLVGLLEYPHLVYGDTIGLHHASRSIIIPELPEPLCYYNINWTIAGGIIEREKISLTINSAGVWIAYNAYNYADREDFMYGSKNPLVAAMQCYVAMKLGESVEIPEDLI